MGKANEFQELDSCRVGGRWAKGPVFPPPRALPGTGLLAFHLALPSSKPQGFLTSGADGQKCWRLLPRPPALLRAFFSPRGGWGVAGVLSHQLNSAPRRRLQPRLEVAFSQAGGLAAVSGRFCELISLQRSGYGGWKEHVCLPDPCVTPLQATFKLPGAKDGKNEAGRACSLTGLSIRKSTMPCPWNRTRRHFQPSGALWSAGRPGLELGELWESIGRGLDPRFTQSGRSARFTPTP